MISTDNVHMAYVNISMLIKSDEVFIRSTSGEQNCNLRVYRIQGEIREDLLTIQPTGKGLMKPKLQSQKCSEAYGSTHFDLQTSVPYPSFSAKSIQRIKLKQQIYYAELVTQERKEDNDSTYDISAQRSSYKKSEYIVCRVYKCQELCPVHTSR